MKASPKREVMTFEKPEDFYKLYAAFKQYQTPVLKNKHMRWYDREFWLPARCTPETSVLEIGSGTGEFLAYLKRKNVGRFLGIERDNDAVAFMEAGLEGHVHVGDVWAFLEGTSEVPFDRVPNMGSPWGGIHQFADLTHKSAFTEKSLEQLGRAAGYETLALVPQRRGSPFRRLAEDCLHGLLSRILTTPPIVWTPNIIVVWQTVNAGEEK